VTRITRRATEADRPAWQAFVRSRPEGDPLQCWAWGSVIEPTGETPRRIVLVEDQDQQLRGLAQALVRPIGLGRSMLYVPHGPLWDRDAPDGPVILGELVDALRQLARAERAIVVKLDPRGLPGGADPGPTLRDLGLRRSRLDLQAPTTRLVELLDGGPALQATWHADARRLARRAEREGVEVETVRDARPASLAAFAGLLGETARRNGFRARSADFLMRAAEAFATEDGWLLALARLGGRPLAGVAVPRVADRAYYLYGASVRDPSVRHAYPAYAALAAAMRVLAEDGVRTLDLWGVTERSDREADPGWAGFSAFKRSFGGRPLHHPGTFDLVIDPLWNGLRELRARLPLGG
jgi:lipid II:glycine glycyltransferase (peptidoglycan interpeptide bridge formation enzyme)